MSASVIRRKKIQDNEKVALAAMTVEAFDIVTIFVMFLKQTWTAFLNNYLKYALYPIAAAGIIIRATLAWRKVNLDRNERTGKVKTNLVVLAMVETLAALAISVAVVGSLACTAIFSTVSPIIFAATLGVKTIYHAGAAIYYGVKINFAQDEATKVECQNQIYENAGASFGVGLISIAITAVMIFAKPLVAPLGIIGASVLGLLGLFEIGAMIYNELKQQNQPNPQNNESPKPDVAPGAGISNNLTNNAAIFKSMQNTNSVKETNTSQKIHVDLATETKPNEDRSFKNSLKNASRLSVIQNSETNLLKEQDILLQKEESYSPNTLRKSA